MSKADKIIKACEKAYEKSGVQGAIDEAKKFKVKVLNFCSPCNEEQPSIAKYCCVCGSKNK